MNKKNKFIILIILLVFLIIVCKSIFTFESINYSIKKNNTSLKIKEIYKKNNYYVEIKTDKSTYSFRLYEKINKRKIVTDIYLYNDESIECILPIIDNNTYTDIMCYKGSILYNYHNIIGEYPKLDEYVKSIEQYDLDNFSNEFNHYKVLGTTKYNDFLNLNNIIALTTYNGLIINGDIVTLFNNDVYNNELGVFIDNYYLVADYSNSYSFNLFYVVNLETKEINKLKYKEDISYDSYIQGIVDGKVYLYDKNNENQYEIDVKNNKISIVSNNKYIKYYTNNKWEKIIKSKANKELYFNYETLDNNFTSYDYVRESENYYYLFKKDGIFYKLYRIDKANLNIYKYIIDVPVTNIYFKDNYLYYVYKNKLLFYSDRTGLKTILENSELEFNETIKYYIY